VSRAGGVLTAPAWLFLWALLIAPLIYGAAFPPLRLGWFAWIGLVPWCVALRVARTGTAVLICCLSTLLGSYICTPWFSRAVATYYQQPLLLGLGLFAGVYLVTIGPYVTAFTLCYRGLARRPSAWLPLLAGAAWAAAEVARTRLFIGDPFGLFGYSQIDHTAIVQIADVTGVYGVSFLMIAVNAALAEVWLAVPLTPSLVRRGNGRRPPLLSKEGPGEIESATTASSCPVLTPLQAWRGLALVAAMLLAVVGYGVIRIHSLEDSGATPATVVAIVQGNLDTGSQWRRELYGRNLDVYMRLTVPALQRDRPAVVVWPESAMTFFLEDEPVYRAALAQLLSPSRSQLVAGGPRTAGRPDARYYNSAFLIAPDGRILATYDKQHLLPFAEYFPLGGIELLRREFARVREFTPGGPARLLPTAAGPAGMVICNEAMFGEIVADRVRAGASYLVTLSNDSWLGDRQYAEEAFDMARLRAVEQRRYLVRASTSGPSAIVDPLGRVVTRTDDETRATVAGTVRAASGLTVYARYGDACGVLCVLVTAGGLAMRCRR
jgi:apolipoprotein N-acyltransferase